MRAEEGAGGREIALSMRLECCVRVSLQCEADGDS